MAQVQLYLAKSQHGYTSLGNINPSEDVARHIHDFGTTLGIIDFEPSRPSVFYLLSYIEEGLLFTLLRPIEGHAGSHYSATLYFPLGLKISKEQFLKIVDTVKGVIEPGTDPGSEAVSELRLLLSADYGIDESRPHFRISHGKSAAFVYIGEPATSLGDFFDKRFYQPEYPDFTGVLLVDRLSGAKGRPGSHELPGELQTLYTVLPPKNSKEGFTPYVHGDPFRRPLLMAKDSTLHIVWRRNGFESLNSHIVVDSDGIQAPVLDTSGARKLISPASFFVTEQNSRKLIKDFAVRVNGTVINDPTPFKFSELTRARVDIISPGYLNFNGNLDLAGSTQALVQMRKRHKSYRFEMPLHTPEPLEPLRIYIKTIKSLTTCPIEGYEVAGGTIIEGGTPNNLIYVGRQSRLRSPFIQIGALVGAMLVGFLLGWLIFGGPSENDVPEAVATQVQTESAAEQTSAAVVEPMREIPVENASKTAAPEATTAESAPVATEPAAEETPDYKAAADYLDANRQWAREEMEAIPGLRGLFDDLNNYNFERIKTHWEPLLKDSKHFNAVNDAIAGSKTKRSPRTAPHAPTYCKNGESVINWRQYTFWVDP